jgi:exonuclease SbcD
MASIRFIHASDLHIGTPFKGLSACRADLADRLKDATFRSFKKIIDLSIENEVDFLVVAGDVFDSQNRFVADQMRFCGELKRLGESGISAYLICGNHDPLCSWFDTTDLPPNVFRFGSSAVEAKIFEKGGAPAAQIFGISYQEKVMDRNLAAEFPDARDGSLHNIAILHATVGDAGPHKNYAPFSIQDVLPKGYDYWALGHIHRSAVVRDSHPAIVYSGNPQGRDFGEVGPKGCYLVELEIGTPPKLQFLPTHVIRFELLELDVSGLTTVDELSALLERSVKGSPAGDPASIVGAQMLRIILKGRTALHTKLNRPGEIEQLLGYLNDGQLGKQDFVWIDGIELRTHPDVDLAGLEAGNDFIAELLKEFREYDSDPARLRELFGELDAAFILPEARLNLPENAGGIDTEVVEAAKWKLIDAFVTN